MPKRPSSLHVAVLLAVALAPLLWVLHLTSPGRLADLTVEDGVIEYLQAACYLVAAVAFAYVAIRCGRRSPWAWLLALGTFLVAGEEISWGQRIFGISTPESFESSNVQGELNLHNLEGVHGSIRALGMIVIVGLFIAIPVAVRVVPALRRVLARVRIPIVPLASVPLALVAMAFMVLPRVLDEVVFQLDEVGELFLGLAVVAYGVLHARAARNAAAWHPFAPGPRPAEAV